MKSLELTFVSGEGGFSGNPLTYIQVARNDKAAIYARSRDGIIRDYEVFRIKVNPKGKKIFATILEDDEERYPSNNDFGRWAWSISGSGGEKRARQLYKELTAEANAKDEEATDEETTVTTTVTVAHVSKGELQIPSGKFTHAELADFNKKTKQQVYNLLQQYVKEGKLKIAGERAPEGGKGKSSKLFEKQ
jgi:hypothetical protein